MQNTVGPYSVLGFLDLALVSSICLSLVVKAIWFQFEFTSYDHGNHWSPTANSSSEVVWSGRRVKQPSGLFSGESADGCCPRLDFYSLRWLPFYWSYRQTNSAQCNERLRLNYFPVYVVVLTFVFTKWQIPPQFCTLQWHSTLFQKILECQYFAKWPEGSHQILFCRIHPLRREGC